MGNVKGNHKGNKPKANNPFLKFTIKGQSQSEKDWYLVKKDLGNPYKKER